MKRIIVLLVGLCFMPQPLFAHVFVANDSSAVVLHIDPNDEPVAGEPATVLMEFTDRSGALTNCPASCGLRLSLHPDAGPTLNYPLTVVKGQSSQKLTFLSAGNYEVEVEAVHPPFHAEFSYFVRGVVSSDTPATPLRRALPALGALVALAMLGIVVLTLRRRRV